MKKKIEFIESKEYFKNIKLKTLKVNNVFIHSKYYPMKEAEKYILSKDIFEANEIGVFGIGLGYHIYEILKVNSKCIINVFDVLTENEKRKFYNDTFLKKLLTNERIKINIVSNYSEIIKLLSKNLLKCDDFIVLKPYMQVLKEENLDLYNILVDFEGQRIVNKKFKWELKYNTINNELLKMDNLREFYKLYIKDIENIFVVSAGPSLNKCGNYLRNLKKDKRNFIIAVGTAVGTLKTKNVNPDAVCIMDPLEVIYKQLEEIKNSDIPLLVAYSASHRAAKEYNGPKYIYYNYNIDDNIVVECTSSVATAAISIAIKAKPKRIFFVGQDLAYVDNKVHSDNTVNGENHVHTKSQIDISTKDVLGKDIYTSKFYLSIKTWIERTIELNKNIKFYNCSRGVDIKGSKYIDTKFE